MKQEFKTDEFAKLFGLKSIFKSYLIVSLGLQLHPHVYYYSDFPMSILVCGAISGVVHMLPTLFAALELAFKISINIGRFLYASNICLIACVSVLSIWDLVDKADRKIFELLLFAIVLHGLVLGYRCFKKAPSRSSS